MADTKFTPGPWFITGSMTKFVEAKIGGGLIQEVASVGPTYSDSTSPVACSSQQQANSHLIAAAPELYKAVEELTAAMKRYGMDVDGDAPAAHREMMHKAESALSRARGEA